MVITYKKAGVDISEIKKSQQAIGKLIESTHNLQKMAKMTHGFGHYAGIVEIPGGKLLATHTDGVGTKVIISNMLKKYDTIGIDCIAMNVNDIICIGATPISFVDYMLILLISRLHVDSFLFLKYQLLLFCKLLPCSFTYMYIFESIFLCSEYLSDNSYKSTLICFFCFFKFLVLISISYTLFTASIIVAAAIGSGVA